MLQLEYSYKSRSCRLQSNAFLFTVTKYSHSAQPNTKRNTKYRAQADLAKIFCYAIINLRLAKI